MKATTPLLLLSLAANLALGAAWLWRASSSSQNLAATRAAAPDASPAVSSRPATPSRPAGPPDAETWNRLDAAGDADFVAQLRAEGFPPSMMFALVSLRLQERHADALGKFRRKADYAYWRKSPFEDDTPPEERAARRALDRRIADQRRQLLGADADLATLHERANRERTYGNLPSEKIDQLGAINRDYSEIAALVRDRTKGIVLPEDREQLAAIEREKRADLVRLLTPPELVEYDIRSSPSAAAVRHQLRNFDATEDEYRALVTLQLSFDATYGDRRFMSGGQEQRRNEAAAELTAQIKSLLPPERFAEYEIKTDPTYTSLAYLVQQYNLPADTTDSLVSAQRDFARRYNVLRQNRDLAPAVRDAQLDALAEEANTRLATTLGAEALVAFKRNGGPINSLLNRPTRKPGGGSP